MSNSKVLSIGALAMDIVMRTPFLPQDDGFSIIESEEMVPGGSASNVSVALQKLGARVSQSGMIGDDAVGKAFRQNLIDEGVDVSPLVVLPGGTTMHTYIFTTPGGGHCIFANRGDCLDRLTPAELSTGLLEGFSAFYTDMFYADAALALAQQAKERGIPVVYNIQCVPSFMERCGVARDKLERMLSLSSLIISGRDGVAELCGEDTPEKNAKQLYERYHPADGVIVTLGSHGALWVNREGAENAPAFSVETEDTTGAGDCMAAGLIYARYCAGTRENTEVLRFASAVAALKCQNAGPRSKATLRDVEEFLKNQEEIHNGI